MFWIVCKPFHNCPKSAAFELSRFRFCVKDISPQIAMASIRRTHGVKLQLDLPAIMDAERIRSAVHVSMNPLIKRNRML